MKVELFLDELDPHPLVGEGAHYSTQVVEVAGEPVHRVHEDDVTGAEEPQQLVELGPGDVLSRGVIGEHPVDVDAVELAVGVLVDGADPDVADPHANSPPLAICLS